MNAQLTSAHVARQGLSSLGRCLVVLAVVGLATPVAWAQAVLGITSVTATPSTVLSGRSVAFDVVVENTGDADATNVVVSHTFGVGSPGTFNSGASSASCAVDDPPTVITCTVGTLGAAGSGTESATVTVVFDVNAAADHQTLVTSFDASGDSLGPISDSATIDILKLTVSKSDGLATAIPGDTSLTYTVSVANGGTSALTAVTISDVLPAGLEPATGCAETDPCWTCTASGGTSDCETGSGGGSGASGFGDISQSVDIDVGGSIQLVIAGDVAASTLGVPCPSDAGKDCLVNSVGIEDSVGAAVDETELDPRAKLVVTKTGPDPNEAVSGTDLVYTFTIENQGPSDAQNVSFTNTAEAGLPAGTYGGDCVAPGCSLGVLAAGSTAKVTVTYAVPSDYHLDYGFDDLDHSAEVTSDTPEPDTDPSPRTNAAPATPVVPRTDLTVVKTSATPSPVSPGEAIAYTVTVANAGPSDAAGATVQDVLIPKLSGVKWTCVATDGACAAGGIGNLDEPVDVAAGGSVAFSVVGTIDPGITGSACVDLGGSECLQNAATVTPPDPPYVDPAGTPSPCLSSDADDQTCTHEIELAREADLYATKDDGKTVVAPGEGVPYTIMVGNAGPADVAGATLSDAVTGPFECAGSSCWTCEPAPELTFVEQQELGGGAVGLDSPRGMAVSPDGGHLYVAASAGNTVVVFERQAASTTLPYVPEGTLTFVPSAVDSSAGLSGARGVAVSPDGAYVYVTGTGSHALVVFARTTAAGPDFGKLTQHQILQDDLSPDPQIVGADVVDGLGGVEGVAVSPDGRFVYAAGRGDDAVVVLQRQPDGTLSPVEVLQDRSEPSTNITGSVDVDGLGGAIAVAVSPDSRHVYVASFDDDAVVALERAADGTLSSIGVVEDGSGGVDGLDGARALAISQDGEHLYAVGETDGALVLLRRASDGTLTYVSDGVTSGGGLAAPGGVAVSPDGTRVLVSVDSDALIKVWARETTPGGSFGTLDPVVFVNVSELGGARTVAMDPAGRTVYASAGGDDAVPVFAVTGGAQCGASSGDFATLESGVDLDLPAGAYVIVEMPQAKVPSGTSLGSTLTNTATVTEPASGVTEIGPLADEGTDVNDIRSLADLSITKSGSADAVPGEGGLTYTLTVFNAGPQAATGVLVNDAFPFADGIASVSWTCGSGLNGGTCGTPSGTGNIANVAVDLPANAGVQFVATATVASDAYDTAPACTGDPSSRCLANAATVALPPGSSGFISDPNPSNNTSQTVETVLTPEADLVVRKSGELLSVDPGGGAPPARSVVYTITVKNCGPSSASDVVLEDEVLEETTALRLENETWSCVASNGSCGAATNPADGSYLQPLALDGGDPALCDAADPGRGEAVITFTADLAEGAAGILTNTVEVSSQAAFDPQLSNNTAEHSAVLTAKADLAMTKVGDATATPGEELTYSLTVTNSGPQDVARAKVVDLLPAELENVTWTCSAESPASGLLRLSEVHRDDGLGAASAVAVSPDGRHVYATGAGQDALLVFERRTVAGPDLGKLTFLEVFQDPGSGAPVADAVEEEGLAGASAVAVSPDGFFVYALGPDDASLVVFSRDPNEASSTFGQLTHAVTIADDGTVSGLAGGSGLAVSPDGDTVYVTSATQHAVVVVDRNLDTDVHEWAATHVNGSGGISGLTGAAAAAVSPDGDHLYVAGATDAAVAVFTRAADGSLTFKTAVTDGGAAGVLAGASAVVLSPDIDGPAGPAVGGQQVYVAAADAGSLVMFTRETDPAAPGGAYGDLSSPVPLVNGDGAVPNVVDGLTGASGLAVSFDGQHLYVSAAGDGVAASAEPGNIAVFRRNTASGTLTWLELQEQGVGSPSVDGLQLASGVAVSPDGSTVYGSGAGSNAVAVFDRAGPPPAFRFLEAQLDGVTPASGTPVPAGLDGANSVVVSPDDGSHVYVASIGADAVAVFTRDTDVTSEGYGTLSFLQVLQDDDASEEIPGASVVDGLLGASALAIDSAQQNLYLASQDESTLVVFDLNPDGTVDPAPRQVFQDAGAASPVAGAISVDGLNGAVGVAVSPDDGQVWVAGQYDAALVVFNRNAASGALSVVQTRHDAGLSGAHGVVGSLDNRHVFVVSAFEDSLLAYQRNADGTLTLLQTIVDGAQGSDGLNRALSVAVSPDDRHVYVTGSLDNSVAVFERELDVLESDPTFGRLSFLQVLRDGDAYRWDLLGDPVAFIDGLSGARSVQASGDGRYVYVAGEFDDALAVFARDADADSQGFGTLTFVESRADGDVATGNRVIDGLAQARSVAVSPDDKHLYLAGHVDDAVASFFRTAVSRCTEAGSGSIADVVDLAFGGTLTYTITGTVNPGASASLVNEATVFDPSGCPRESGVTDGCNDTELANNVSSWTTSLRPSTDIGISKSNGVDTVVPGQEIAYSITVTNEGPSNVLGATVSDLPDAGLFEDVSWTCLALPSGALDFVSAVLDGDTLASGEDLRGLRGTSSVAFSPDGRHAYVASAEDHAVAVFAMDPVNATLTFQQLLQDVVPAGQIDGATVVQGLGGATAVTVDPTGQWVYVAGKVDDTVVVLSRDAEATLPGGDPNPAFGDLSLHDSLGGDGFDQPVALVAVANHLYVAAANDDAVVAVARDGSDVHTVVGVYADGVAGDGLDGAGALAVSPDGTHLYVAAANDDAVAWLERDPATGGLTYLNYLVNGEGTEGLQGANGLAVSPDGLHVYVTGGGENALAVFTRDWDPLGSTGSGALAFQQVYRDGQEGVDGLRGADDVVLDAAGTNVYVSGRGDDAIAVFRRDTNSDASNPTFGDLVLVEVERDSVSGVNGLAGARDLAISGDDRYVLAAGTGDDGFALFRRPADSSCPAFGTGSPSGALVNLGVGGTVVFTVEATVADDACSAFIDAPCELTISNTATVRDAGCVELPGPPPTLDGCYDPVLDDNVDTDEDDLVPRADLAISKTDGVVSTRGLAAVAAVAVAPDGEHVYAASPTDEAVGAFARDDGDQGRLDFRAWYRNGTDGVSGLSGAAALVVSPDGRQVYVAGSSDNTIVVFDRDWAPAAVDATGELSFSQAVVNGFGGITGLLGVADLALSPAGHHLYAVGSNQDALAVFERNNTPSDVAFGTLQLLEVHFDGDPDVSGLRGASSVCVSPDGRHVVATGFTDDAVLVFSRDANPDSGAFGSLTPLQTLVDGADGVDGVAGPRACAISADGRHVYVLGAEESALAVFDRDAAPASPTFGELALLQVLRDDQDDVDGLAGGIDVAVSVDGRSVYVAGEADDAVAVFDRTWDGGDPDFGRLAPRLPLAALRGGVGGAASVAVSGDGTSLYVAAAANDAIAVFDRHWDAGGSVLTADPELVELEADKGGGLSPGDDISYEIRVVNHGPSAVYGATVTDYFPAELEAMTWSCTPPPGGSCRTTLQDGDLIDIVSIPAGATLVYTVNGRIKPGTVAEGIVNTAAVEEPTGVIDVVPGNNSAADDDTLLTSRADLQIEKVLLTDPAVAGDPVQYRITVLNTGPSTVRGAMVVDRFPETIHSVSWTCDAEPDPGKLLYQPDGIDDLDGLGGARGFAEAPDGRHAYAVGLTDDSVVAYRRELRSGRLVWLETVRDGDVQPGAVPADDVTVAGLEGPSAVLVSPDGAHVYVAGSLSDSVAVFTRDVGDGTLRFSEAHTDLVDGVFGIGGARDLAFSPDGGHLYVAGEADDAVAVFSRDAATGSLTFVESVVHGQVQGTSTVVAGLLGARAVALSPDGSSLYAAGADSSAVAVFDRDGGDGRLTFLQQRRDGVGDVDGLAGASDVQVTPDGGWVLVTGRGDDAVAVFEREPTSGGLTFVEWIADGDPFAWDGDGLPVAFVDGLAGASALAVSGDGEHVYVTGSGDDAVSVFARDAVSGALTFIESIHDGDPYAFDDSGAPIAFLSGLLGPEAVVVSGDDDTVYVAAETGDGLLVFTRLEGSRCTERGFGDLQDVVELSRGGTVTYLAGGIVSSSATGVLTNRASVIPSSVNRDPLIVNNSDEVSVDLERAVDLAVTKSDGLDVATPGTDVTYQIVATNQGPSDLFGATLTDLFPVFTGAPGDTPGGFLAGSVAWSCLQWSQLTFAEAWTDAFGAVGIAGPAGAAAAPDLDGPGGDPGGRHLYVPAFTDNVIRVFARDAEATDGLGDPNPDHGRLTLLETVAEGDTHGALTVAGLDGPTSAAVSPDGHHVYVTGQRSNAVALFSRDDDPASPDYGTLTFVDAYLETAVDISGLDGASDVVVSPDGRHVYVAGRDDDAVVVFSRDDDPASPSFGRLTWVERKKNGFGPLPFGVLDGAWTLAVSPDGEHLYVGAWEDDALSVFRRDADTGMLTLVEVLKDDEATTEALDVPVRIVQALEHVASLAMTPSGEHLYAASLADDAIFGFRRDGDPMSPDFGRLFPLQIVRDGVAGMDGLDGAIDVTISPDGAFVYAAAVNDDALSVFARVANPTSAEHGMLTLLRTIRDGDVGSPLAGGLTVDGLDAPRGLLLSPDGAHLYSLAELDDAIGMFARTAGSACPADGDGSLTATVDLAAGASILIQATGTIDPGARGELVNTVTIAVPAGVTEREPSDNVAVDVDQLVAVTDLAITKTNGVDSVVAGRPVTWVLTVTNAGPSHAIGATVTDFVSPKLLDASWTCVASAGSSCTAGPVAGAVDDIVDVLVGGTLTYTLTAVVDPGERGSVANSATVEPFVSLDPATFPSDVDPDYDPPAQLGDNVASDVDPIVPVADLMVTKDDGVTGAAPGQPVTYTIVVSNLGPSDALLATVSDVVPAELLSPTWTCAADAGATCTAGPVAGDIDDTIVLPVGLSVVYTLTATVDDAASGELSNTVTVDPTPEATDPETGNNIATDVDSLQPAADLEVTKTTPAPFYVAGALLHYDVVVRNLGPSDVVGARVEDLLPGELTDPAWICTGAGGASCPAASGIGDLVQTVDLPAGSQLTFEVEGVVDAEFTGLLVNTATVAEPFVVVDTDLTNNAATASTPNEAMLFADGFETGSTVRWSFWEPVGGGKAGRERRQLSLDGLPCLAVQTEVDPGLASMQAPTTLLEGRDLAGAPAFRLVLQRFGEAPWLAAGIRQEDGRWLETGWVELVDGRPSAVTLQWWTGSAPRSFDGGLDLWLEEVLVSRLSGVGTGRVRLGFLEGPRRDAPTAAGDPAAALRWRACSDGRPDRVSRLVPIGGEPSDAVVALRRWVMAGLADVGPASRDGREGEGVDVF